MCLRLDLLAEMRLLLLLLLAPPSLTSSPLGMTLHAEPLDVDGGRMVRAHFTCLVSAPCPVLSAQCEEDPDCQVHITSSPLNGTRPGPGWCVRQWQKNLPSVYNGSITLGSDTEFHVWMDVGPKVRLNNGKLNHPASVALPPPLRARVKCPRHFPLTVKDVDGDKVRCRFARAHQGECVSCPQHSFITLDEEKCVLTFTGEAVAGRYFLFLVVEDVILLPKSFLVRENPPLSSAPLHLSLSVEESSLSCNDEPVSTSDTPAHGSALFVLPFQEVKFNLHFLSTQERVTEVAVVGPPQLYRVGFQSIGPLSMMTLAWVRSENNLTRLLPVCFTANTESLQSEPRCVWLYQREMRTLPEGTELRCERTQMSLSLPVSSLSNIDLRELQLNNPLCPVTFNQTHLRAHIPLSGCGTKTVHTDSELIYVNTLRSVHPFSVVRRRPALLLPLACRIPRTRVQDPRYRIQMPTEEEVFGKVSYSIEFHRPGTGPLAQFTRRPQIRLIFRSSSSSSPRIWQEAGSAPWGRASFSQQGLVGSRLKVLDLHVMSSCSLVKAQLLVSNCVESDTEDFNVTRPFLKQGCAASNSTVEIVTSLTNVKIYRLSLEDLETTSTMMYVRCRVNLCVATMPSQKCPDLCAVSSSSSSSSSSSASSFLSPGSRSMVNSVFTKSYIIQSEPVSLVYTTAAPTTPTAAAAATTTTATAATTTTTAAAATTTTAAAATTTTATAAATASSFPGQPVSSPAPGSAPPVAAAVVGVSLWILLHNFLH